jgi:hypothetical protein
MRRDVYRSIDPQTLFAVSVSHIGFFAMLLMLRNYRLYDPLSERSAGGRPVWVNRVVAPTPHGSNSLKADSRAATRCAKTGSWSEAATLLQLVKLSRSPGVDLKRMIEREEKLLIALVYMVDQYLERQGDEVDSLSMTAGEHAIEALAAYGLMEVVNARIGRWTEAGKRLID